VGLKKKRKEEEVVVDVKWGLGGASNAAAAADNIGAVDNGLKEEEECFVHCGGGDSNVADVGLVVNWTLAFAVDYYYYYYYFYFLD
jgi:hypothetical protein